MAYQQDFNEDEQKKNEQSPEQVLSADNSPESTVPGTGAASSSQPEQQKGTGFTNLSTYVNANKEQSADMANNVTGDIRSGLAGANGDLNTLSKTVSDDATANTVKDNGVISALGSDPTKVKAEDYNKQIGGYKGPNDVAEYQSYQDLSTKYSKLDQQEKSLSDPYAIQTTLKEKYNRPSYTQGENSLDSFLTTSGAGADTLHGFQNEYNAQNPTGNFANKTSEFNNQLGAAKQASIDTQNATKTAYDAALANSKAIFDKNKTNLDAANANTATAANTARADLSAGNANTGNTFGLSPQEMDWLRANNYNMNSLVNTTGAQSLGDVTNEGDISNYMALLGLTPGQQSAYDFTKTGNNSMNVGADQQVLGQYKSAYEQYIASEKQKELQRLYGNISPGSLDENYGGQAPQKQDDFIGSGSKSAAISDQLRSALPAIAPYAGIQVAVAKGAYGGMQNMAKKTENHKTPERLAELQRKANETGK